MTDRPYSSSNGPEGYIRRRCSFGTTEYKNALFQNIQLISVEIYGQVYGEG